jgi:hypothetical protein
VARCLGWGRHGWKSTGAGCPWWHGSAKEERQWWSGGVAEGTGKEVRGAPGIGAELEAVMESSERTGMAFCGSSMMVARRRSGGNGRRRKRTAHGEEHSF